LENEHNTWHTPEDAALKQHFPDVANNNKTASTTTANVGRRRHHNASSTTSTSFAGRLKLFTPEYFELLADGTPRLCTSSPESATAEMGPDDDDDDDASNAAAADAASSSSSSSVASSNSDGSFLQVLPENAPEESSALSPAVNAMLDRWQHQLNNSSTNRNQSAGGDSTNHLYHHQDDPSAEDGPPTVGTCATMAAKDDDSSSTTEEKQERAAATDPTTTTTTTSDPQQELVVVPAEEASRISFPPTDRDNDDDDDDRDNNNTNEEGSSDSNSSDDSDGDSVDYGGAETSVWQGVGQSFLSAGSVIGSTSNRNSSTVGASGGETTTNAAVAATTTTTTTNPPPMTTSTKSLVTSTDRLVMDNYDHYDDDDGDDDMAHQGAEVFLYMESKNKYNNNYTTDATTTAAIGGVVSTITTTNKLFDITEAKQHQRENIMTETERIIQETTAAADNYEDLEFTPRLEEDDNDDEYEDLTFPYKSPSAHNKNNNLKLAEILLSPDDNNNNKSNNKPQSQQRDNLMSPLSAMVHPINLDLFRNDDIGHDDNDDDNVRLDQSFASSSIATTDNCDNWSVSSCPVSRRLSDMIPSSSDRSVGSSRTSSSFRSSSMAGGGRVRYSLSTGKRSMSKAQRQYSKDFLPKSLLVLPSPAPLLEKEVMPRTTTAAPTARTSNSSKNNNNKHNSNNSTLSVLLVDVQQHIFEVIAVDCYYKDDCTVGDVLSKARASATDPALSEQKYISLVYGQQEFAAPMLKIHAAVDFTINPDHTSRPLALAVPEGSNARQVQYIKMILWKNPKMKRWWNVEDPFMPSRMDSITEITVPTSPKATATTKTTTNNNNNDDDQLLLRKKNQVVVSPNTSTENEEEYDGNVEQVIAPTDDDDHDGGASAAPPKEKKNSRVSILRRRLDFVKWW
jgi:hypothetical protein